MHINKFEYLNSLKKGAVRLVAGLALTATAGSCGITQQDLTLATQTFHGDVGLSVPAGISGIPNFACSDVSICAGILRFAGIVDSRLSASCDQPPGTCGADVKMTIYYTVDLSHDSAFTSGLAPNPDWYRDIKLRYGITSTVNVDVQKIDVYLGPGTTRLVTDPGVQQLGTVGPVPKNSMSAPDDAHTLLIQDGTPAHDEYIGFIKDYTTPFRVLMVVSTHLQAGDPIPTGTIDVALVPTVTILRR